MIKKKKLKKKIIYGKEIAFGLDWKLTSRILNCRIYCICYVLNRAGSSSCSVTEPSRKSLWCYSMALLAGCYSAGIVNLDSVTCFEQ